MLAGFGDQSTGQQQLTYLNGIVHTTRGYRFSSSNISNLIMGPFILGTVNSSRGDSGKYLLLDQINNFEKFRSWLLDLQWANWNKFWYYNDARR